MKPRQRPDRAASDPEKCAADADIGLAQLDGDGRVVYANARFYSMFRLSSAEVVGRPLDGLLGDEVSPLMEGVRAGLALHVAQTTLPRYAPRSGVAAWINPIIRDGVNRGSVCTFVDTGAYGQSDDPQHREIKHRMRNVFAIAQALVGQTLRGAVAPNDAVQVVAQRMDAISHIATGMLRSAHGNLALRDIVKNTIAIHGFAPARIVAQGPDLDVGSKAALAISLALHELCTNAVKYGALSSDKGRVALVWSVGDEPTFRMRWQERSGPPVVQPGRKGFGTRLIVDNLGSDVGGRSELTFPPEGARWLLEAPLKAMVD